jgi:hypothetical protein
MTEEEQLAKKRLQAQLKQLRKRDELDRKLLKLEEQEKRVGEKLQQLHKIKSEKKRDRKRAELERELSKIQKRSEELSLLKQLEERIRYEILNGRFKGKSPDQDGLFRLLDRELAACKCITHTANVPYSYCCTCCY